MPFVDIPGLRIHYLESGTGPEPVVLLHGFPETSHQWRHQLPALADAGYTCFAPDNRGFGRTEKPDIRISRGLLARDVVRFLDAVGVDSVHLVGHDWGGIIAFKVVADHPDRVRSVALLDTLCTAWAPRARHGWWFKAEGLAEEFFAHHAQAFIEVMLGGRDGADLPGPPASPWAVPAGPRGLPPWMDADSLRHYVDAFRDPACWSAAIQYYRYGLPFHALGDDGVPRLLPEREVGDMWLYPGGLDAHPDSSMTMDFAPEDRSTSFGGPALWLHAASASRPRPDHAARRPHPFVEQFARYFPGLVTQPIEAGHFLGEEAPTAVNEALVGFLRSARSASAEPSGAG